MPIALKHPRDRTAPVFRRLVERVYEIMTATAGEQRASGIGHRLPSAQVTQLLGVLDEVSHPTRGGHADLAALADALSREIDRSRKINRTVIPATRGACEKCSLVGWAQYAR